MTQPYAANVIACLHVQPGERFQALVDEPFADVGIELARAATAAGATSQCVVVPDAARPLRVAWDPLVASLDQTDALCFWFQHVHDGEFEPFRKPLYERALAAGTRVAFGGRLDRSMLEHEMAADYGEVRARSARLIELIGTATTMRITTPAGTDLTLSVAGRAWKADDGDLSAPSSFGNLPAGEVFIAPLETSADGVCVIDCSCAISGLGAVSEPFRLLFEAGRVIRVEGGASAAVVWEFIQSAGAGADVIAELGIGTNERARIRGSIITDEKVLGTAHVAFGDNCSSSYGGVNQASIHIDNVMADATIEADGRVVISRGVLAS